MKTETTQRFMTAIGSAEMFDSTVSNMFDNMSGLIPPAACDAWKGAFLEVFTADSFAAVVEKHLYARFTEAELIQIAEFFETGVGKKWQESSAGVTAAMQDEIKEIVEAKMPEVTAIFERLVRYS